MKWIKFLFGYLNIFLAVVRIPRGLTELIIDTQSYLKYSQYSGKNIAPAVLDRLFTVSLHLISLGIGIIVVFTISNWETIKKYLSNIQINGNESLLKINK